MISEKELNRIKIKDLMAAVKKDINPNVGMGMCLLEMYAQREASALQDATDEDLRRIEKIFIDNTLGIKYFPHQLKKKIRARKGDKVVPIDYIYESKNA